MVARPGIGGCCERACRVKIGEMSGDERQLMRRHMTLLRGEVEQVADELKPVH